jgi:hypothetical protein
MDPILLLVLCAHGAQFSEQHAHKADDYFCQAKASIEGPLSQPNPSTVIALCLLSLYEPIKDAGLQKQSSMYAAMAFQMCFDLGLMRSYNDKRSAEYSLQKSFDVIEQRKRICWSCYYLDKMIHLQTGQPWMMRSKDIELDMPLLQPGDDIMEHEVLEGFVATIKLLQIAERVIQPESLQQAGQPVIRTHTHDQMSLNLDNELLHWLRCLPVQLQWTPTPTGSSHQHLNINSEPPLNPMVGTMHLIYNFIELHVLRPYTCSTVKSIHQRAAAVATNITQLIMVLSDKRPLWIFHCGFASTALIEATRVQLSDCACENLQLARHSRYMFQQSMHSFRSILTAKPIPSIIRFIQSLDQVITFAETKTTTNEVMSMMEEDIMTPFVLGSLNNKHGYEDEKPQWPKVDPFPNHNHNNNNNNSNNNNNNKLVDKSNKNGLYPQYHSAITDNALFQPSWRMVMSNERQAVGARYDQDQANDNGLELDFLSDQSQQQSWQPYLKKSTPSTSAILNRNMEEEEFYFKKNSQTPSQLLLDDPKIADPSHIAALVAHIQDAKDQGTNDTHETNASASWVNADPPSEKQDVLLLSLWQDDQEKHNRPPPPSYVHYPNVGLGIYASAHQHHNDVIRQHFSVAETARASPSVRSNEP